MQTDAVIVKTGVNSVLQLVHLMRALLEERGKRELFYSLWRFLTTFSTHPVAYACYTNNRA